MKKHIGCPKKQKHIQKETFPSYELYNFKYLLSNFSVAIAGACINIAANAQQLVTPRGTHIIYSWATADKMNTKKFAANFDQPLLRRGVQQCLMKKK